MSLCSCVHWLVYFVLKLNKLYITSIFVKCRLMCYKLPVVLHAALIYSSELTNVICYDLCDCQIGWMDRVTKENRENNKYKQCTPLLYGTVIHIDEILCTQKWPCLPHPLIRSPGWLQKCSANRLWNMIVWLTLVWPCFGLTVKVLVVTIDAQREGMGDVGSARYSN